jgi:hypothetical protein
MSDFLKGNYPLEPASAPAAPSETAQPAETKKDEFERRALERLGGSIAFVIKKDFVWKGDK